MLVLIFGNAKHFLQFNVSLNMLYFLGTLFLSVNINTPDSVWENSEVFVIDVSFKKCCPFLLFKLLFLVLKQSSHSQRLFYYK